MKAKRLLALLLSVLMIVGMLPTAAFADGDAGTSVSTILADAANYEYSDHTYKGVIYTGENTVDYYITKANVGDGKVVMRDMARYLGALYRSQQKNPDAVPSAPKEIKYHDVTYKWGPNDDLDYLKGSNWRNEDTGTLVSKLVSNEGTKVVELGENETHNIVLAIDGTDVTFTIHLQDNPPIMLRVITSSEGASGATGTVAIDGEYYTSTDVEGGKVYTVPFDSV